jgi:hypothetical protein
MLFSFQFGKRAGGLEDCSNYLDCILHVLYIEPNSTE